MNKEYIVLSDCRGMYNDEIIDTIFNVRKIKNKDKFMNPTINDIFNPRSLYRIKEAVEIVREGVQKGKHFCVFADV